MKYVRKRDGRLEKFDNNRIINAIWKAAKAVGGKNKKIAKKLSNQVIKELEKSGHQLRLFSRTINKSPLAQQYEVYQGNALKRF